MMEECLEPGVLTNPPLTEVVFTVVEMFLISQELGLLLLVLVS